jgi:kynureninase
MIEFDKLAQQLQPYYSQFNVANRLLFTGHSHQAWPDAAFEGTAEYMRIASQEVDKKWDTAFKKTEKLRSYLRRYYDDPHGNYCREQNTHVLMVSWLSSLDLKNRPKIITTAGEFHSMYRQLRRLQEAGLDIIYLPHDDDNQLLNQIQAHLDEQTSAIMLSRVYFETAEVNTKLSDIAAAAREAGVPLLIDDYHGTNVVPLSVREEGLEHCYILIGGYKYLQWGEANCFLRFPESCTLRPVVTGWFSAFGKLDEPRNDQPVDFDEGDQKFATATYDPVSQFRAAAVVDFFDKMGLSPEVLTNQYRAQVSYLRELFDGLKLEPDTIRQATVRPVDEVGGFLALRSPKARQIRALLLEEGIYTDARGDIIRFGPAPYTTSEQCRQVMTALKKIILQ